ncbi:sulfatase-like hydrolase/transferase [Luteolibacter flavescens]|uniref:Sulfatase-like hydrolase/transferase n=1 Tax=Luteolibacter flavescens TaxID=1859460 RepID=A0ABT3FRY3_9BACT|nr:sulfatase-like hydrolase/transferase [Luteolibacter flavescens]MCW1886325.1 sulfatase-like hydrolase/transferase [Luteolibacter flavescens]
MRTPFLALLLITALPLGAQQPKPRPNVIVILTDDQGYEDAGCYGAKDLKTPAIDRIAAAGVKFTQFYAASCVCSPSRAGLMTGRYPWKAGLEQNGPGSPSEAVNDLSTSKEKGGLPAAQVTMAEVFHDAGYATAHIGKWHLGHGDGTKPLDQGFDYSFGHMGGCIDNWSHFFYWAGPNRHDLWEGNRRVRMPGRFFPDLMVEKTAAFIEQHRERPFFIYFAINLPHYPYQGDPAALEEYASLPYPRNLYAATVSTMDARIGKLLDHLDRLGVRDDTIIVFQSDHGASSEERAHGGGGSAGPYRGGKFSFFEGGIRVPAVISWPAGLPSGESRDAMAHGCDWLPTLADLCGVKLPEAPLDGRSLAPVIRSADAPTPHAHLEWKVGEQWCVRQGPWKLIHRPKPAGGPPLLAEDKEWFLANIADDPAESKNRAADHPEIVAKLRKLREEQ